MAKSELEAFPTDILVDATKSKEAVFVHPDQSIYADSSIADSFKLIDDTYKADPETRIRAMAQSVGHFRVPGTLRFPAKVNFGFETSDSDGDSNELMILTSPLNDGQPWSGADRMVDFIKSNDPGFLDIARTRPNSWGPLVKLDIGHQLSKAMGRPMPHFQIFSPVTPHAFSAAERAKLAFKGDYSGYGRVALEAVNYANAVRKVQGKQHVEVVHYFGAGIGQRAIAAARFALDNQDGFEVGSVHAMNLALRRGVSGTTLDHMKQREVNEPSGVVLPSSHVRIDEPRLRQDTDHRGTDTLQMFLRQGWALKDLAATSLPHATKYKPTVDDVRSLIDANVPVRVTNGLNVGMAINTLRLLPVAHPNFHFSTIVGLEGQKVSMMSNEHAGVVAVAMSLGIRDYHGRDLS